MSSFTFNEFGNPNSITTFQAQPQHRDHISTSQLSRIKDQTGGTYPSPADSSNETPPAYPMNTVYGNYHQFAPNPDMPPPFTSSLPPLTNHSFMTNNMGSAYVERPSKKRRLSPSFEKLDVYQKHQGTNNFFPSNNPTYLNSMISPPATGYQYQTPANPAMRVPPTPAASVGSEDNTHPMPDPSPQPLPQESPDFRRLSVKSLLSDDSPADSASGSEGTFPGKLSISSFNNPQKTPYGIDRGFSDLDTPKNQDATALSGITPIMAVASLDSAEFDFSNDLFSGFGFGVNTSDGFQEGAAYYSKPVTVSISRTLEPLPSMLRDNPMNLLYFHHFLNHTARILVPHDCSENPFKSILPQSKCSKARKCHCTKFILQWLFKILTS